MDPWELTATRPDASEDGLHFGECERQDKKKAAAQATVGAPPAPASVQRDQDRACIDRVANHMFFNTVCAAAAS